MKKSDFDRQFIKDTAENLFEVYATNGILDKPMINLEYNMTTDSLNRDGEITNKQRSNWCVPKGALNMKYLKRIAKTIQ